MLLSELNTGAEFAFPDKRNVRLRVVGIRPDGPRQVKFPNGTIQWFSGRRAVVSAPGPEPLSAANLSIHNWE